MKKISLSEAYPLPDFEFVFLLTAFVPVVLPILTTQFYRHWPETSPLE